MPYLNKESLDTAALTGETERHLCSPQDADRLGVPVHKEVVRPFLDLRREAAKEGFDLQIDSGFRSFDRQLSIWNRKAQGELPVLDSYARPMDIGRLSEWELALSILRWSALPGASRHHWGTDLDVFDEKARPEGYEIDLVPEEVEPGGMFGPLHDWLDMRMGACDAFGFFRPYDVDRNGVAPERWHLSCFPVAQPLELRLTPGLLRETLAEAEMELKDVVLDRMDEVFSRFVSNIGRPPE